jgi:putative ATPase
MKQLDYGSGYKYAHDFPGNFAFMEFLPEDLSGSRFYEPGANEREKTVREWLKSRWRDKYGY